MGYSKNKNSLLRVQGLLDILVKMKGTEEEFIIPSKTPYETLYSVREGLKYAEEHKVENYADLKETFILKYNSEGILVKPRRKIDYGTPIQQLAKSQHLVLDEVTGVLEMIGAAIQHKAPKLEFPNANVEGDGLKRLEKWATLNQYKIVKSDSGIIMERESINVDSNEESGIEHSQS